jgi:hypothetical protein
LPPKVTALLQRQSRLLTANKHNGTAPDVMAITVMLSALGTAVDSTIEK